MRRLLTSLVILGALGTGADVGVKQWAEGQIESRARAELPEQSSVAAHIRGFPFLPPLFFAGRVSEADGHFENVPAGSLLLAAVDIELRGVKLDRNKLIGDRKVRITDIDEGTVSIEITAAELSKALGLPISITSGQLKLAAAAASATGAKLSVRDNALVIEVAGVSRRVAIPKTRLVPCASSVTVLAGRVRLSCTIRDVPAGLLGEANARL